MPKLKKSNKSAEEVIKETTEISQTISEDTEKYYKSPVDTDMVQRALDVVSESFNLDKEYHITGFADKGNKVKISLSSPDFNLDITICDPYACGIKNFDSTPE